MTDNEVHPLVTLLTERMKTHPEEFEDDYPSMDEWDTETTQPVIRGRWQFAITEVYNHGSEQDADALREGMRAIRLDKAHEWALDELLNGDERRAKERRDQEERIKQARMAQTMSIQSGLQNIYPSTNTALSNATPTYPSSLQDALQDNTRQGFISKLLGSLKL